MPTAEEIVKLFNLIGSLVCHQRPERTLWVGGHYLPVCARDTGACIGFLVGYAIVLLFRRKEAKGPPNLYVTLAMMVPLLVDSFSQIVGLRASTNDLRLVTGLLFGTALTPLLIYALSLFKFERKIPLLRSLLVKETAPDSKDSWLGAIALLVGIVSDGILFFAIRSIAGSDFYLYYWLLSIPIILVIIMHMFVLPLALLALAIDKALRKRRYAAGMERSVF